MGKFSISSYLLLAASCPLPLLLPLTSNAGRKQPGVLPFPFGCQRGEQLMNSFSLSKMVDRRRWCFAFSAFPPLSCVVQWQKGEFLPTYVWRKGMGLAALAALCWPGDEGMPLCHIPMPGGCRKCSLERFKGIIVGEFPKLFSTFPSPLKIECYIYGFGVAPDRSEICEVWH